MRNIILNTKKSILLLRANIIYSFQQDTAFIFNNWTNLLSTIFFTISWILLINIIYSNTNSVAGYNKDEMLLFALLSQIVFYMAYTICMPNIKDFISSVNSGGLDLLLTKPVPSLFYVMTKKMNLMSILRDGTIPLLFIALSINYQNISALPLNVAASIIILLLGIISTFATLFISAVPVFWLGQSEAITDFVALTGFDAIADIPYEGFNPFWPAKFLFTWILPFLVADALSTSVFLGKTPIVEGLLIAVATTCISVTILAYIWRKALKSYSSASS